MTPSLFDALQPYRDPKYPGAISLYRTDKGSLGPSCDNYHLFTAHAHNIAYQIEAVGDEEAATDRCFDLYDYNKFLAACEIEPGLYARYPGSRTQTSQDEILGILYMDSRYGTGAAIKISNCFFKYKGYYNTESTGKETPESYLARHPCMAFGVPLVAHQMVGMTNELIWAAGDFMSLITRYDDTSGKLLEYLQVSMYRDLYGPLLDMEIDAWCAMMTRLYPGGARELFTIYFGAGHPFSQYAPTHFNLRSNHT